jgi:hypothetical protein
VALKGEIHWVGFAHPRVLARPVPLVQRGLYGDGGECGRRLFGGLFGPFGGVADVWGTWWVSVQEQKKKTSRSMAVRRREWTWRWLEVGVEVVGPSSGVADMWDVWSASAQKKKKKKLSKPMATRRRGGHGDGMRLAWPSV